MIRTVSCCLLLMLLASTPVFARQESSTEAPSLHDAQILVMEGTKPLPEHDRIRAFVGAWDYSMLLTMPDVPAMRAEGTARGSELLDGRFVQLESISTESPHVSSLHIFGYDGREGHESYFDLTLDTLGQYFTQTHGHWDETSASLELRGEEMDSFTGLPQRFRQVYSFLSRDTITCEFFIMPPGTTEEIRVATMVYERRNPEVSAPAPAVGSTGRGRLVDLGVRSHGGSDVTIPRHSVSEIESMDRAALQSSLLRIMRARTLDDLEPKIRSSLDIQYDTAMSRLRSMRRGDIRAAAGLIQPPAPGMPEYSKADLEALEPAQARRALMEIATARRDPKLTPYERERLRILFRDVYDQVQMMRRTRPSDLAGQE
ncbi:MAG TPA: hypothetical protein DCX60_04785 [Phycisphaerales bacterium]|nr:hypothetical protein [Phycisphaerales bacterium]